LIEIELLGYLPRSKEASSEEGRHIEVGGELFGLGEERRVRGIGHQHFARGDSPAKIKEERIIGEARMPKDEEGIQLGACRVTCEELVALHLGSAEGESLLEAGRQLFLLLRETIEDIDIAPSGSGKSEL
jgi:hypothetical protein